MSDEKHGLMYYTGKRFARLDNKEVPFSPLIWGMEANTRVIFISLFSSL